jgi:hypothetical protein
MMVALVKDVYTGNFYAGGGKFTESMLDALRYDDHRDAARLVTKYKKIGDHFMTTILYDERDFREIPN